MKKRIKYWLLAGMMIGLVACSSHHKKDSRESDSSTSTSLDSNYWRFAVPITLKFLQ